MSGFVSSEEAARIQRAAQAAAGNSAAGKPTPAGGGQSSTSTSTSASTASSSTARNPNAGYATANTGAVFSFTSNWEQFNTGQQQREVTAELTTEQKKIYHLMRALCALNPEVFGNTLTINGAQLDEYIHSAATGENAVGSLTIPKSLKWELDPLYAPPKASSSGGGSGSREVSRSGGLGEAEEDDGTVAAFYQADDEDRPVTSQV